MAKANKKSAKEASQTFHNIMAASVKGNPKPDKSKSVATINLNVFGTPCTFNYTITKTTDEKKKDRFWNFEVTHENDTLKQSAMSIPKSFSFRHDTFNNITECEIGTFIEFVCEQILMKELS